MTSVSDSDLLYVKPQAVTLLVAASRQHFHPHFISVSLLSYLDVFFVLFFVVCCIRCGDVSD